MSAGARLSRGLSTVVLAAIIAGSLLLIAAQLLHAFGSYGTSAVAGSWSMVRYAEEGETLSAILEDAVGVFLVTNVGTRPLRPDVFVLAGEEGVALMRVRSLFTTCEGSIWPRVTCEFYHGLRDAMLVAMVTYEGHVLRSSPLRAFSLQAGVVEVVDVDLNSIRRPEGIASVFIVDDGSLLAGPTAPGVGRGMNGTYVYLLNITRYDVVVKTSGTGACFGVIAIARNVGGAPGDSYNVMITFPRTGSGDLATNLTLGGSPLSLGNFGVLRVQVYGFRGQLTLYRGSSAVACIPPTPSCPEPLGIFYYGYYYDMRVAMDGKAEEVRVFGGVPFSAGISTSYLPYLFVGDLDGNGANDVVFITEDASFGDRAAYNDRNPLGSSPLFLDSSTTELVLKLNLSLISGNSDGSVEGATLDGLIFYVRVFLHDNSFPDNTTHLPKRLDLSDVRNNQVVLRLFLVSETGALFELRSFDFYELMGGHRTVVENPVTGGFYEYVQLSAYVPLPPSGRFWVAIGLKDPFSCSAQGGSIFDDLDLTIGFDTIHVIPVYKPSNR